MLKFSWFFFSSSKEEPAPHVEVCPWFFLVPVRRRGAVLGGVSRGLVSVVGGGGVEGKQGEQALMWGYFSKAVDLLVCVPGLVVCQVIRDIICKKLGNNFDSHLGFSAQMFLRRLLFSSAPPSPRGCFTTLLPLCRSTTFQR